VRLRHRVNNRVACSSIDGKFERHILELFDNLGTALTAAFGSRGTVSLQVDVLKRLEEWAQWFGYTTNLGLITTRPFQCI